MYRAIPIKWKVSGLNASKSEIVVKTITLRHTIQGYFLIQLLIQLPLLQIPSTDTIYQWPDYRKHLDNAA